MVKYLTSSCYNLSYEIKKVCLDSPYAMVKFYTKVKSFFIHESEIGYYICDDNIKFYFDDIMNEYLKSVGVKGISNELENEILNLK